MILGLRSELLTARPNRLDSILPTIHFEAMRAGFIVASAEPRGPCHWQPAASTSEAVTSRIEATPH